MPFYLPHPYLLRILQATTIPAFSNTDIYVGVPTRDLTNSRCLAQTAISNCYFRACERRSIYFACVRWRGAPEKAIVQ